VREVPVLGLDLVVVLDPLLDMSVLSDLVGSQPLPRCKDLGGERGIPSQNGGRLREFGEHLPDGAVGMSGLSDHRRGNRPAADTRIDEEPRLVLLGLVSRSRSG